MNPNLEMLMQREQLIEIEFTKQELQDLHSFLLKNHLQVKQSVIDKIDHKMTLCDAVCRNFPSN